MDFKDHKFMFALKTILYVNISFSPIRFPQWMQEPKYIVQFFTLNVKLNVTENTVSVIFSYDVVALTLLKKFRNVPENFWATNVPNF